MNYIKLKEEIGKLKISEKAFLKEYCDIGVQGFNKAIKNNTLSIRSLELISKGLNFPMSYWWQDKSGDVNDPTMQYGNRYEGEINALKMLIKELQELKQKNNEKLDQQEAEIKMLNTERRAMLKERQEMIDEMEELRRSCGLKKEGTSGL